MDRMDENAFWIDAWLADDWAAVDPEYPTWLALLNRRRAGQSWHKHSTFRDHLVSVYRMLKLWRQDRETCLVGLFHSVYSNEYVDLALFDPSEGRPALAEAVGADIERSIHRFCTIPRTAFVLELLKDGIDPSEGLVLRRGDEIFELTAREVAMFTVVTVADLVEQWYSWQEDTMSSYPHTGRLDAEPHWAVTLWPGPFRPGTCALALASRLARHLPALGESLPQIFAHCGETLDAADEAAASALYWQAATLSAPLVDSAHSRGLLERAVALNPWVGEPHLLIAQIDLIAGRFDRAEYHARTGLERLGQWGIQWDKRVSWEGWVVWASMLVQRARRQEWPRVLRDFNNLGLVTRDV